MLLTSLDPASEDVANALSIGDATLSRSDLRGAAGAVASRIAGATRVAVEATASAETVVAVTGCLLAGVAVVPVPPGSGSHEVAHILSDSGAELLLGSAREGLSIPTVRVDITKRVEPPTARYIDSATALIMYTSETTGAPKGVALSNRAIAAGIDGVADAWAWTPDDVLVHGLPLFHVHGLILGALGPLRIESKLTHTVRPKPRAYAAASGSMYFGVPTVWSRICSDLDSPRALSRARLLVSGSAAPPVPVFEQLRELTGHSPVERYGMSETIITLSNRAHGERRPGWMGLPLGDTQTRILGGDGQLLPHDEENIKELELRGSSLFDEHIGRADANAKAWTDDGWFKTGDVAAIDAGEFHRIVGRASIDLIKVETEWVQKRSRMHCSPTPRYRRPQSSASRTTTSGNESSRTSSASPSTTAPSSTSSRSCSPTTNAHARSLL